MGVACVDDREKALADRREQARRYHPIGDRSIGRARQASQIGARSYEFVPLGEHDPGTGIIELQPSLHSGRNLDRAAGMVWRAVRYGQHQDADIAIFIGAEGGDNGAGTILLAFVAAFEVLAMPEVAVADGRLKKPGRRR
jgi:hypothetical protein